MKMLHVAIGLAIATGLSACETAFSGPMSGQTAFVTDNAAPAAGAVTTPESCPDPWPIGSPDRNNGDSTAFSDRSFSYEGC